MRPVRKVGPFAMLGGEQSSEFLHESSWPFTEHGTVSHDHLRESVALQLKREMWDRKVLFPIGLTSLRQVR